MTVFATSSGNSVKALVLEGIDTFNTLGGGSTRVRYSTGGSDDISDSGGALNAAMAGNAGVVVTPGGVGIVLANVKSVEVVGGTTTRIYMRNSSNNEDVSDPTQAFLNTILALKVN